jgi:hypothetical protein
MYIHAASNEAFNALDPQKLVFLHTLEGLGHLQEYLGGVDDNVRDPSRRHAECHQDQSGRRSDLLNKDQARAPGAAVDGANVVLASYGIIYVIDAVLQPLPDKEEEGVEGDHRDSITVVGIAESSSSSVAPKAVVTVSTMSFLLVAQHRR